MLWISGHVCGPLRASPGGRVNKIIAVGGRDSTTDLFFDAFDLVEVYEISSNKWKKGE